MENTDPLLTLTLKKHGYLVRQKIGSGGFATVYLAHNTKYDLDYAIKQIKLESVKKSNLYEIDSLVKLIHPGIITIFEHFQDEEYLYLVLEYCPNGALNDFISTSGPLSGNELVNLCLNIATALQYCHDNSIAHLDIKPANIFLDKYHRPKLADFGLSHHFKDDNLKSTFFSGSYFYQSPQIVARMPFNPFKADVWSLGCTFYYLCTGNLPFHGEHKQKVKFLIENVIYSFPPNVDERMITLIKKMLQPDENDRPQLSAVAQELQSMLDKTTTAIYGSRTSLKQAKSQGTLFTLQMKSSPMIKCARIQILQGSQKSKKAMKLIRTDL